MHNEGDLLWTPSRQRIAAAHLTKYLVWLARRGQQFAFYEKLRQWSIEDLENR